MDTLVREAFKENQVRVTEAVHLGYQEVLRLSRAPYAQVRMVGIIGAFEDRRPDSDGGRMYRRLMTSLAAVPEVLGWGSRGARTKLAARTAEDVWGLPIRFPALSGYVD